MKDPPKSRLAKQKAGALVLPAPWSLPAFLLRSLMIQARPVDLWSHRVWSAIVIERYVGGPIDEKIVSDDLRLPPPDTRRAVELEMAIGGKYGPRITTGTISI